MIEKLCAIAELTHDEKIRHIRDAEWYLGCEHTRGFESMSTNEINAIYDRRFVQLQAIYAPNATA